MRVSSPCASQRDVCTQYRHQGRIQLFIQAKAFRDRRMGGRGDGGDRRENLGLGDDSQRQEGMGQRQTGPEGSIYKAIVI